MTLHPPHERARWAEISYWLAWIALGVALVYLLASYGRGLNHYRVLHNSDAAYIALFYRDALAQGSIAGWDLPTNPYFFPDMALLIPLDLLANNLLANNRNLSVVFYAVAQLLLTVVGLLLLQRQLFGAARLPQTLVLLGFTLCILLIATWGHLLNYYPLMPSHHFGALVVMPYALAALLRALEIKQGSTAWWRVLAILFVLCFLTVLSDFLFILQFVLPALFMLVVLRLHVSEARAWWRTGSILATLLLSALAGQMLRSRLVPVEKFMLYSEMREQEEIQQAFAAFEEWALRMALEDPLLTLFWLSSFVALLGVAILGWRHWREDRQMRKVVLVAAIVLLNLPITVAATIASGNFVDDASARYLLTAIFLPLFLGWPLFLSSTLWRDEASSTAHPLLARASTLCAALLLGYMLLTMRPASLAAIPTYQDPFVACLQQEAAQRNLRYGLAEYWQADTITALSRDRLHIAAVDKRLSPFLWNGNPRNYQYPFEFVISNPAAAPTLQISEETIRQKFGTPDDQFACDGSFVFVYDRATTPQLRHWFAHHPDLVTLENVGDVAELYGYTLQSPIGGATTGLSVGANEEVDQDEGTLAYASLAALPAGSYAFALDLYTDNDDPGLWEIIRSVADEREVLVSATITQRGASTIMGRFDLESESNVNVVVKYNGRGALYVDRIRIARVEAGQTANSVFAGDAATTALIATEGSPQGFLSLVYPNEAYALDGRQIYFVWQWTGEPLPAHQTFEVRLWRKGESVHYGAHDARASRASIRRIGDTYMLRLDLSGAYSVMQHGAGDYEWTVALVAIDPTYQDLQIEAQPRTLRLLP